MKKKTICCLLLIFVVPFFTLTTLSCTESSLGLSDKKVKAYYYKNKGNTKPSISEGTVSNGGLKNAKLLPFSGNNYRYFDRWSYLQGRAFLNGQVLRLVLDTYAKFEKTNPSREFVVMECSHQKGGKLWPHRTHQNGLSVDFMMPLKKGNKAYYGLDSKGITHYLLEFDNQGKYKKNKDITVDFNLVAKHLLFLDQTARKYGYKVKKVIIKIEFKDELYATSYGKRLKKRGVYVVKGLTPKINALHDDHYHVDFEKIRKM